MSKPVVITGQGGVNLLSDSTGLALNETQIAANVFPNTPGTFGTRKAMSFLEPFISQTALTATIGAAVPQWGAYSVGTFGAFKAFAQSTVPGVEGVAVVNIKDSTNLVGSQVGDMLWLTGPFFGYGYNLSTVLLNIRGANQYTICNVGQRTIVLDGNSSGFLVCRRADSISGEPLIDLFGSGTITQPVPPGPDDIVIQRLRLIGVQDNELQPLFAVVRGNRLVFGAPDAQHPSTVFWGDAIDQVGPDSWRTVPDDVVGSRSYLMGTDVEGGITAMWAASISPDASTPQTAAYVWKAGAMYMSTGEPGYSYDFLPGRGQGTINGTLDITRLNTNAGCVAKDSIAWSPQGMVWAGQDDVWMMGVGQAPRRVGTKIRPMLLAQPISMRHRMHAAFHEGAYKLAMFSDGQGPTDESACAEQWWLDLRFGDAPEATSAKWWGPQTHDPAFAKEAGTYCMCLDMRPGNENALVAPQIASVPQDITVTSESDAEIPVLVSFEAFGSFDSCLPTLDYEAWQASTAYLVGEVVRPGSTGGREFVVVVAGTSDVSQPAWNTLTATGPSNLVDGTVTWMPRAFTADTDQRVPWTYLTPALQVGHILFDLKSREFSEPDARLEKLLDGLDLVWKSSQPLAMNVTLLPDQESTEQATIIQASQPSTSIDPMPLTLTSKWGKRFLPPKSDRRSRAPTFQVRLQQLAQFMIPYELRYLTFFPRSAPTTWLAFPIVGGGDSLASTPTGYAGTADFDANHAPHALPSAILAAGYPAGVLAGLGFPVSFAPASGELQSTPGQLSWGDTTVGSGVGIPWDETPFGPFDPANIDSSIRDQLLAANRFWLSLMGFGASTTTDDDGGNTTATFALPNTAPAIVVIKEFTPRVRVFRRSPT